MALYNLNNPYDKERFVAKVAEIEQVGGYVEIKRKHPQRSTSQNSYLHILVEYYAIEMGYGVEQAKHDVFKMQCNADIFIRAHTNKQNNIVPYIRSTNELTAAELTTAIERFRNYASAVNGIYLPQPNEEGALFHAQQTIENNKQ